MNPDPKKKVEQKQGLAPTLSEGSEGSPSERIGVICQRCYEEDAAFRVFTDAIDIDVCPSCAEQARQLKLTTEDLPCPDPKKEPAQKQGLPVDIRSWPPVGRSTHR